MVAARGIIVEYPEHVRQELQMLRLIFRALDPAVNGLSRMPILPFRSGHVCATFISLLSVLGITSSCKSLPPPPMIPTADDMFVTHQTALWSGLSDDPPPRRAILPGDVIRLRILSSEPYDPADLWVDALGCVHLPIGADVDVSNLELREAEARIEQAWHKFDRYARANVDILSFGGHRVIVGGAVDKPGGYEARPGLRIADIIAASGGARVIVGGNEITEAADVESGRILREGKTLPVRLDLALVGEPSHNIYVRPGDIIYIPWASSRIIPVLGDVRTARNVPFHRGIRLTEALAAAGGASRTADTADIRILRGPLSRAKVYRADLDAVVSGKTPDVELAPGDVIFVTEHWFATTTDVLNRLTPLLAAATVSTVFLRQTPSK